MPYSDDSIGGHGTIKQNAVPDVSVLPDQLVGAVLNDRYQIERKLGHGGCGTVYLATDNKVVSRKIVVKVLHTDNLTNDWTKRNSNRSLRRWDELITPALLACWIVAKLKTAVHISSCSTSMALVFLPIYFRRHELQESCQDY
jgi:serine/threonine protein kinase